MNNRKTTKRALWSSVVSLLICFAMLLGTTYAWFTDSVTSSNNVIKSGNLDVDVYYGDPADKKSISGVNTLFNDVALWEPGAIAYENLTVANLGTLALKYRMALNFTNATETAEGSGKTLVDVLKVAVVVGGFSGTREDAQNLAYNYSLSTFALDGQLEAGASDVYGVVIYWEPTANDNDYNVKDGLSIDLGISLVATQWSAESDAFGSDYDVIAPMPEIPGLTQNENNSIVANVKNDGSATMDVDVAPSANINKTVIDAPAGTFEPTDKVEVSVETVNSLFNVNAQGAVVAGLDVTITVNGAKAADLEDGKFYTVTTYISKGLENVSVAYTGTDGKAQPTDVTYDAVTGKLTFKTSHFSNYAVSGKALAYDTVNDVALVSVEKVVEAAKAENSTVIIPEANQVVIQQQINQSENLTEEEKAAAIVATAAAKIGDTTYPTLAEAFAAVKNGETIVLLNGVNLVAGTTFTVASGNAIVLDLNGKTIVGIDNTTANFGLINVASGATLTVEGEGKIALSAINNNGWNRYSSVISNQRGTLIVNGGTIEHLGGTDMSYAIDNLTNTGAEPAKTVINGGTVQSTYIGIRQFCNAATGLNELEINGGTVIGAKRSVWMQQPNSIVNLAKLTINGGTLKGALTIGADNFSVAVSGGNFTDLQTALKYAVDGATIGLAGDATLANNETITIANGFDLVIDLNGYSVTSTADKTGNQELFLVKGNLTVKNGSMSYTASNNQGWNAMITLFDVTAGGVLNLDGVKASVGGSDMNFIVHLNNWGSATLNVTDCDFTTTYVAIRAFNSGYDMNNIVVENTAFHGGRVFWVHNYTSEGKDDTTLNVDIYGNGNTTDNAKPIRYGFSVSEYYTIDGAQIVSTADELKAALAAGKDVVLGASLNDVPVNTTAPYGNKYGVAQNGGVLDGNGNALNFAWLSGDHYGIMTAGGTIKNLAVGGAFRGILIMSPTEDVIIDNVVIDNEDVCYAVNTAEGDGTRSVIISNSVLKGWSSIGNTVKDVSFTNCTFGQGTYYTNVYGRIVKPYVNATFTNCEFNSKFYIDLSSLGAGQTVVLENCTVNGVKLTAENWTTLLATESACGEGQISIELRDGSFMTADNVADYVIIK